MAGMSAVAVYVLIILLKTILYGCMTASAGLSAMYFMSCVSGPEVFTAAGHGVTSPEIVAVFLAIAAWKFFGVFRSEVAIAYRRLIPFS